MKIKQALIVLMVGLISSCGNSGSSSDANIIETSNSANNPNGNAEEPIITFEHETWDFGTITEGEVVEHSFTFKNTGKKPLLISEVQASCGCTIPEWPREPIRSGQEGNIKIQFNSNGKHESINKDVTIYSNANPVKKKLFFKAYVKNKPESK
jgi:hypothetical protein